METVRPRSTVMLSPALSPRQKVFGSSSMAFCQSFDFQLTLASPKLAAPVEPISPVLLSR